MQATFCPKNKRFYPGKHGRLIMSHAGQPCDLLGEVHIPADQTRDRKPLTWAVVRFPNYARTFQVRPCDLDRGAVS